MPYVCGYILHFSDGRESEGQVLHTGTKEECEKVMELMSAVSYSGDRPLSKCEGVIREVTFEQLKEVEE
jgi:hypothetical protein